MDAITTITNRDLSVALTVSRRRQVALAIVPKISSLLSILGSLWIVSEFLFDEDPKRRDRKRNQVFSRLMFAMCVYEIMEGCFNFLSSWAVPKDTPNVFQAMGNQASCNIQGFFLQVGLAVPVYNASLSLYYLLVIRYNISNKTLRERVEPMMHLLAFLLSFGTATACYYLELFNFATLWCWISPYPIDCKDSLRFPDEADCERGDNAWAYRWGFYFAPLWTCILFACFAMVPVYLTVRKKDELSLKYRHPEVRFGPTIQLGNNSIADSVRERQSVYNSEREGSHRRQYSSSSVLQNMLSYRLTHSEPPIAQILVEHNNHNGEKNQLADDTTDPQNPELAYHQPNLQDATSSCTSNFSILTSETSKTGLLMTDSSASAPEVGEASLTEQGSFSAQSIPPFGMSSLKCFDSATGASTNENTVQQPESDQNRSRIATTSSEGDQSYRVSRQSADRYVSFEGTNVHQRTSSQRSYDDIFSRGDSGHSIVSSSVDTTTRDSRRFQRQLHVLRSIRNWQLARNQARKELRNSYDVYYQARWYLGVFCFTHFFSTCNRTLQLFTGNTYLVLTMMHSFVDPCQGFLNFLVYRRPRFIGLRRRGVPRLKALYMSLLWSKTINKSNDSPYSAERSGGESGRYPRGSSILYSRNGSLISAYSSRDNNERRRGQKRIMHRPQMISSSSRNSRIINSSLRSSSRGDCSADRSLESDGDVDTNSARNLVDDVHSHVRTSSFSSFYGDDDKVASSTKDIGSIEEELTVEGNNDKSGSNVMDCGSSGTHPSLQGDENGVRKEEMKQEISVFQSDIHREAATNRASEDLDMDCFLRRSDNSQEIIFDVDTSDEEDHAMEGEIIFVVDSSCEEDPAMDSENIPKGGYVDGEVLSLETGNAAVDLKQSRQSDEISCLYPEGSMLIDSWWYEEESI